MKKRLLTCLLAGMLAAGTLSGCGQEASAPASDAGTDQAQAGQENQAEQTTPVSDEKIDVLNQTEKMKLAVVCLQGYTQPESQIEH